jgi:predicted GTPase
MASPIPTLKVPLSIQDDLKNYPVDVIKSAASEALADYESGRLDECGKEQHFLIIGRSGTGKTSLAGVLIEGKSAGGSFGGNAGTTQLTTIPFKRGDTTYYVHDTRGLGDKDVSLEMMKDEVKQIYDNSDCLVIVCIRWDDRLVDDDSLLPLNVCNSLSDDVWSKAIIAITHCDRLSRPTADDDIIKQKEDWKDLIQQHLQSLKVNEDHIKSVHICFTSHTDVPYCKVEPDWMSELLIAILIIAPKFKGDAAFNFIIHKLIEDMVEAIVEKRIQKISSDELANAEDELPFPQPFNVLRQVANESVKIGADIGGSIGTEVGTTLLSIHPSTHHSAMSDKAAGRMITSVVGAIVWLYVNKS